LRIVIIDGKFQRVAGGVIAAGKFMLNGLMSMIRNCSRRRRESYPLSI